MTAIAKCVDIYTDANLQTFKCWRENVDQNDWCSAQNATLTMDDGYERLASAFPSVHVARIELMIPGNIDFVPHLMQVLLLLHFEAIFAQALHMQ